jgi:hypothetical protein
MTILIVDGTTQRKLVSGHAKQSDFNERNDIVGGLGPKREGPAVNLKNFAPEMAKSLEDMSPADRLKYSGLGGRGRLNGDVPDYIKSPAEKVFENGNAFVVLGIDRPGSLLTGYGGVGNTHCGAIDIVAGRMGSRAKSKDKNGDPVLVNPNFKLDAARIYLSQKSNVDSYFGLVAGRVGNTAHDAPQSTVALKADAIRIIGREGIKLVTKTDRQNSQGGNVAGNPGIDLIGGNDDSDLQPLVKGTNLVKGLQRLSEIVAQLRKIMGNFAQAQLDFNRAAMTHTHNSPFYGMMSAPSAPVVAEGVNNMKNLIKDVQVQLQLQMQNQNGFDIDYLSAGGAKYINSRWNNTN